MRYPTDRIIIYKDDPPPDDLEVLHITVSVTIYEQLNITNFINLMYFIIYTNKTVSCNV